MNTICFKISGVKVFDAKGVGTIRWGIYYSKLTPDEHVLKGLRLIYLGRGFFIQMPFKWFKKYYKR